MDLEVEGRQVLFRDTQTLTFTLSLFRTIIIHYGFIPMYSAFATRGCSSLVLASSFDSLAMLAVCKNGGGGLGENHMHDVS